MQREDVSYAVGLVLVLQAAYGYGLPLSLAVSLQPENSLFALLLLVYRLVSESPALSQLCRLP